LKIFFYKTVNAYRPGLCRQESTLLQRLQTHFIYFVCLKR
jgi:hypothetical protein